MKDLDNLNVELLNKKELCKLNGGESGFYYLGKGLKAIYNGVCDAIQWMGQNAERTAGCKL